MRTVTKISKGNCIRGVTKICHPSLLKDRTNQRVGLLCCIILVFTRVLSALIGCGMAASSANVTTVSILAKNSWYTTVDYANSEIIQTLSDQSGYQIDWTFRSPSNYYDAVRPLLLSNSSELSDIVQLPDLDSNMEYIQAGVFIALDDYMDEMPNFSKYLEENPEIKASLTTEDGHIYYVPQTVLTENYQPVIMYNQEWLDKLGLSEPQTLEEFVTMLRLFAENDMNGNGDTTDEVPMSVMESYLPYMFGSAFGLNLVNGFYADEEGVVHYSYYESEQYEEYLTFLHELYDENLLESSYETLTRDEIANRCANDQTGVIIDYSWQMSTLYDTQYEDYNGGNPVFTAGVPLSGEYEGTYIGRSAISGLFGVTSSCSDIQSAVKLLDYIMGESSQELYCWGIEGLSYEVDEEGNNYYTENAHDDTWLQDLGINPVCVPSQQSVTATDELLPQWHSRQDKELQQYIQEPFPFIYATNEEAEVIDGYENYIAEYVVEQRDNFITGQTSMDTFNAYLKTLKDMNIEEIIAVKQKQYDRYVKMMSQ